jgi:putative transposase
MTDSNINVGKELLPELLTKQGGLAKLLESVLN